jgi:hypothetical protein
MTDESKMKLIHAAGMLDGLAYVVGDNVADALCTIRELIDEVLEKEKK